MNGGRSFSPQATDVQAVAAIGAVIFAGTWKHGVFASRDGGATFQHQAGFPSNDIRSVCVVNRGKDSVVYAATARDGVCRSQDRGASWTALGPGRDFFWSLSADEERVYAVSLEKAIYIGRRTGRNPGKSYSTRMMPTASRVTLTEDGSQSRHRPGPTTLKILESRGSASRCRAGRNYLLCCI